MEELVNPNKLVSVAAVAPEFGYNPNYLARLAAEGKIRAWRIGKTWITTREIIAEYIKTNPAPGRPLKPKIPPKKK